MAAKPIYLGIDLGTTNSTAAAFDGEQITIIRNAQGSSLTPSVVRLDGRGHVTVGTKAFRFLDSDPANCRGEFKRLMGTQEKIAFPAAGVTRSPQELSAEVLKALRADVQDQLGFAPTQAVITVPALFELPQNGATSDAARLAGFERVELLQEPVASALAAGWTAKESTGSWLVYDLGGGTFDVSLLETRDGLLRVVGHDGDNFLGGRDIDTAIVEWVIEQLQRTEKITIDRANPEHAPGLRKLRRAAEEAKIELARARSTSITVADVFRVDGQSVDVDLDLSRDTLDTLSLPLVERSIAVCERLLVRHGLEPKALGRVVLVGGPTFMEVLRRRVGEALQAPFGEGLDPMTLVAQGAAIYAATAALDARPAEAPAKPAGRKIWLQYPAMTSDLTPHVVGRLVPEQSGPLPARIRLKREDGLWESPETGFDAEGAFMTLVELLPRRPSNFRLDAVAADGSPVPLDPPSITIMQGLTVTDPPLSRTIGVALANDRVRVYFERGSPLPAKRRYVQHTVETVARGTNDTLLRIPIVQGEFELAHLCRLVGTLEISGATVQSSLPAGSEVEVTLELDRGGRLSARALVPVLNQVFEQVAHLVVPDVSADSLDANRKMLLDRLITLRGEALRRNAGKSLERLALCERDLATVAHDTVAARGGDADAAQKARRTLIDVDCRLEEIEAERMWPDLDARAVRNFSWASSWVSEFGTPPEQRLIAEAGVAMDRARKSKNIAELQRQIRVVVQLGNASYYRSPGAWSEMFNHAASHVDSSTDLPKAQALVREGRQAQQRGDDAALRNIVDQLWRLMPVDGENRRLAFESGVR
jgi:molecular chaperone DnaK